MVRKGKQSVQRHIAFEQLRKLREQMKLTQEEVALKIGVSEKTYNQWEMGKATPNFNSLLDLADFFHVTADYLMGRTDDPHGYPTQKPLTPDEQLLLDTWRNEGGLAALHILFERVMKDTDKGAKIPDGTRLLKPPAKRRRK